MTGHFLVTRPAVVSTAAEDFNDNVIVLANEPCSPQTIRVKIPAKCNTRLWVATSVRPRLKQQTKGQRAAPCRTMVDPP